MILMPSDYSYYWTFSGTEGPVSAHNLTQFCSNTVKHRYVGKKLCILF